MADPNANPEKIAAEPDDQQSTASAVDAPESDDPGDTGLAELESSLDTALADAESRMADLVGDSGAAAVSIDALDEHLADSTPDDLDIRTDPEGAEAPQEVAPTATPPETDSEEAQPSNIDDAGIKAAEAVLKDVTSIASETPSAPADESPSEQAETSTEAATTSQTEAPAEAVKDDPVEVNTPEPVSSQPELQESAPADQEPAPESDSGVDEKEVLIGQDAEREPDPPAQRSPMKALAIVPRIISTPLVLVSPEVRDMIGWMALVTAFNAALLWAYILFLL